MMTDIATSRQIEPPPRRRRRRVLLIGSMVVAALGGGVFYMRNHAEAPTQIVPVVVQLNRGDVTSTIAASGNVRPVSIVRVSTLQGGTLRHIPVDFNSDVHKGDLLAQIDDSAQRSELRRATAEVAATAAQLRVQDAQIAQHKAEVTAAESVKDSADAAMATATAELRLAETNAGRQATLQKGGFGTLVAAQTAETNRDTSKARLNQAQSEFSRADALLAAARAAVLSAEAQRDVIAAAHEQAVAREERAKIDLDRTRILSPVDGTIVWKSVDVGQTVSTNVEPPVLFFIAQDLTEVQIETTIDENDVSNLRVGLPVSFTVAAYPSEQFAGEVRQIRTGSEALFGSKAGAASAVTYIVEIATANKDRRLLPGMTASVRIITEAAQNSLTVPNTALRYGESVVAARQLTFPKNLRPIVLIDAQNNMRLVSVKTLASDGLVTAIDTNTSIAETDRIVIAERPAHGS